MNSIHTFFLLAVLVPLGGCSVEIAGPNRPPVALAGPHQTVETGKTVVLSGILSFDPDGDSIVNYRWRLLAVPLGGTAGIDDQRGVSTTIEPNAPGLWMIGLVVGDGKLESEQDVVQVRVVRVDMLCTQNEDCDDQQVCTDDLCNQDGSCSHSYNQSSCDDGDPCSTQDACSAGVCVAGATNKDSDLDGYLDENCPEGSDCDDEDNGVSPGGNEGPSGDPSCSDGKDNDCDGTTDGQDPSCAAPEGYRKRITIDFNQVGGTSNLVDFPVLVDIQNDDDLRSKTNGGDVENVNGYDITFRASDGTTMLDYEIEGYDPATGTLVAWVRVPVLSTSADTIIYIYYGYAGVDSPTENPGGVWDSGYRAVWHLREDPAGIPPQIKDSTGNQNHGTSNGTSASTGQIAGSLDFDGNRDYVNMGNASSLNINGSITIEAWVKLNAPQESMDTYPRIVSKWWGASGGYGLFFSTEIGWIVLDTADGSNQDGVSASHSFETGTWYHLTGTWAPHPETIVMYINGVEKARINTENFTIQVIAKDVNLGGDAAEYSFNGGLDEVRISAQARSSGWVLTSYNNQISPSGFYRVGDEESGN